MNLKGRKSISVLQRMEKWRVCAGRSIVDAALQLSALVYGCRWSASQRSILVPPSHFTNQQTVTAAIMVLKE